MRMIQFLASLKKNRIEWIPLIGFSFLGTDRSELSVLELPRNMLAVMTTCPRERSLQRMTPTPI